MSPRPILLHMNAVENALQEVSPQHAFAFAAACAERQWPVYKRASEGKPWEKQAILRSALDAIWDWLLGRDERPRLADQCESAIFDGDPVKDEDTAAFYVANSFFGLATIVEKDQPHHCRQSAVSNLDALDAFLYELYDLSVCPESDTLVDSHELIQKEMRHQLEDLRTVEGTVHSCRGRATPQEISRAQYSR